MRGPPATKGQAVARRNVETIMLVGGFFLAVFLGLFGGSGGGSPASTGGASPAAAEAARRLAAPAPPRRRSALPNRQRSARSTRPAHHAFWSAQPQTANRCSPDRATDDLNRPCLRFRRPRSGQTRVPDAVRPPSRRKSSGSHDGALQTAPAACENVAASGAARLRAGARVEPRTESERACAATRTRSPRRFARSMPTEIDWRKDDRLVKEGMVHWSKKA